MEKLHIRDVFVGDSFKELDKPCGIGLSNASKANMTCDMVRDLIIIALDTRPLSVYFFSGIETDKHYAADAYLACVVVANEKFRQVELGGVMLQTAEFHDLHIPVWAHNADTGQFFVKVICKSKSKGSVLVAQKIILKVGVES
jgi:hypothetical protein